MADSTPHSKRSGESLPWRDVLALTLLVVALWVVCAGFIVVAGPRLGFDRDLSLEGLTYAALLCLVPGWLVFVAIDVYGVASSPLAKLGVAMAMRLTAVLGGVLVMRVVRPDLGMVEFVAWLLLTYLATLALETRQMTRRIAAETPAEARNHDDFASERDN